MRLLVLCVADSRHLLPVSSTPTKYAFLPDVSGIVRADHRGKGTLLQACLWRSIGVLVLVSKVLN